MPYDLNQDYCYSVYPQNFDLSNSDPYFITICTHERECLLGQIQDGQMQLSQLGEIVAEEWQRFSDQCQDISLDHWVIMPNHIHGIVTLNNEEAAELPQTSSQEAVAPISKLPQELQSLKNPLTSWIARFKAIATERINQLRQTPGMQVWQPNDYKQSIQHLFAFQTFRQYICTNTHAWQWDKLHPDSPDWASL